MVSGQHSIHYLVLHRKVLHVHQIFLMASSSESLLDKQASSLHKYVVPLT